MSGGVGAAGSRAGGSEQAAPAVDGPAAAQQLLPLHAANLVVVIPGQLCASSDPPGKGKKPHGMGQETVPEKRRNWVTEGSCTSKEGALQDEAEAAREKRIKFPEESFP